jgi:hypothetical protein
VDHDRFIDLVRRRAGVPASRRLDGMPLTSQLATRTGLTEEETRRGVQATLAVLDYRELLTPRGAGA